MFSIYDMYILLGCLVLLFIYMGAIWFDKENDK